MSEPRSELRLRDLGREAEYAVDLPDLGSLERRGRAMRFRRQAAVVAAAVVVAVTSVFLFQDRSDRGLQPAPPQRPHATAYPGNTMQTLEAGTYEITASSDGSDPTVMVTLPDGWNAAEGPNRFAYLPGKSHDESLVASKWAVGLLAFHVTAVGKECASDLAPGDTVEGTEQTVAALRALPDAVVVGRPGDDRRFGYPATEVRLTVDGEGECDGLTAVFGTDFEGKVGVRSRTFLDIWVVDVDGTTLVVAAGTRGEVPQQYADEMAAVLGSVRFVPAD